MVDNSEMIFGVRAVIEAIQAGKEIDKILVKKDIQSDLSKELFAVLKGTLIPVQRVPVERINRVTRKNHQGVIAFISSVTYQKTEDLVPFLFEQGKMAVEAAEEDERSKYSPNPEWMGQMDLVNSRANARILAPQLLKQAQDCARILSSTTEPSTFFMRYDFCVGRLMMLEDCKKYGVNAATTDSLNKYTDLDFRDGAIEELIHRTQIKYSNKILTLKTSKAKENWAAKYSI